MAEAWGTRFWLIQIVVAKELWFGPMAYFCSSVVVIKLPGSGVLYFLVLLSNHPTQQFSCLPVAVAPLKHPCSLVRR